jgi:rubrerythrin
MVGMIARWVFRRVTRSALAFEMDSVDLYRRITAQMLEAGGKPCSDDLQGSLCHLLEEEQAHWKLLEDAATGHLSLQELERLLAGHAYARFEAIEPLSAEERARWEADLHRALAQEEETWIFYSNLRRMSKIPVVKRVFEVLAAMEKEHLDILRRLLGLRSGAVGPISS